MELHHTYKREAFKHSYFAGMSVKEREKVWKLESVVKRADSYSCAERDIKENKKKDVGNKRAPLDSIFSRINLIQKEQQSKKDCRYHVLPFAPQTCFPQPFKALDEGEILKLVKDFETSIPDFSTLPFELVLTEWMKLLEKYTWAIPSDTRYETSDVSLYDHLSSSAAIAACLYKRHIQEINRLENMKTKDEFILIGGDFSGIQSYIFNITNSGSGAAKRLRARSFFISLFSETTIHKILHSLDLPLPCNLFSAGGKFILIAPNVPGLIDTLREVKSEVDKEIHDSFFSQFSFLIELKKIDSYKSNIKVYSFFKFADELFYKLEKQKVNKAKAALIGDNQWNPASFRSDYLYKSYFGHGDCHICGKGPALYKDDESAEGDETISCSICNRDRNLIGRKLPHLRYIAFGKGLSEEKNDRDTVEIFKSNRENMSDGYFVRLLKKIENNDSFYLVYDVEQNDNKVFPGMLSRHFANYVPSEPETGIISFENLAKRSRWQKADTKECGSDMLGVLKADVDNLGLVFSKGFEKPDDSEKDLKDNDRKTVSRFLTLSRLLELFFSGWMKDVMKNKSKEEIVEELLTLENIDKEKFRKYLSGDIIDFKNIYTVYSGGDDLVLVGPWETMIIFAIYLNQQFRKYTCCNKSITLSAGLTFIKEKFPIASAIKQAEKLLEKSKKEKGKERITFFGTTVRWEKLSELVNSFLFFNEKMAQGSDTGINTAFLHRLLSYHQMALKYIDDRHIEGLKYLSALSYDIGRNIVKWDKEGKIISGSDEHSFFQSMLLKDPSKDGEMYSFKIPFFWTLYKHRRSAPMAVDTK